jgi:hypothetical protein
MRSTICAPFRLPILPCWRLISKQPWCRCRRCGWGRSRLVRCARKCVAPRLLQPREQPGRQRLVDLRRYLRLDEQCDACVILLRYLAPLCSYSFRKFHVVGSVLSYVFYWIAAIVTLVALKWREGRVRVLGLESSAGRARRLREEANTSIVVDKEPLGEISELPR